MWLYKMFLIKKKNTKEKKKRDNTHSRFPPLQICFMFLPALLGPRLPCPRCRTPSEKCLHPPLPCFFYKSSKRQKKGIKKWRNTKKVFFFLVSAGLMLDASSVGMLNCIVKYKNRLIFYYEVEKRTKKHKS